MPDKSRATRKRTRRKLYRLKAVLVLVLLLLSVFIADRLFPPPLENALSSSVLVTDRNGVPLRAFPTDEGRWRLPADMEKIDPAFIEALIEIEDKRFRQHWGVDGLAVMRAIRSAIQRGRVVSGASTITMQTARMLEPRPRTLPSKAIEMLRAFQLEVRLSKDEILELYLTLTPYGGNLEGIRAASWAYFGREPDRLSDDQIALLIALPQSPEVRRPDLRPESALASRKVILERLVTTGHLSATRGADAAEMPLPGRYAFPARGWHAADTARSAVLTTHPRRGQVAPDSDVRTTLDAGLQASLEKLAFDHAAKLDDRVQIAVLVAEAETGAVRAHVGSAERGKAGGWIDLTTSARSPGSTLKPFIYGLAFDDGQALPDTFIEDLPARFNTYRPENFDRNFRGMVRISDALQHSLNVPAVLALDRIGPDRFASALRLSGIDVTVYGGAEKNAGLALALGGAGMTLRDLTRLYGALGHDGRVPTLKWIETDVDDLTTSPMFFSSASAAEITRILQSGPTPEGRMPARLTADAPEIAFKTGTSYGFRDAWAGGYARGHAVVVWVGRADGAPRPGETGRTAALPILFDVFDRVDTALDLDGDAASRLEANDTPTPRQALTAFQADDAPPVILFPPEDASLLRRRASHPSPGFVLSGRGSSNLAWFVDGIPVPEDDAGAAVWTPPSDGFFTVSAVDRTGQEVRVRVRVISPGEG